MSANRKRGILHQENLAAADQDRQRQAREEYRRQLEKQMQERQAKKAEQQLLKRKFELEEQAKMDAHWQTIEQRKQAFPERPNYQHTPSVNLLATKESFMHVDADLACRNLRW